MNNNKSAGNDLNKEKPPTKRSTAKKPSTKDNSQALTRPPSATRTELVFILDRSGSMSGLESDTIGGYNAMLRQQQGEAGEATVTTVLFDDRVELLHDRIAIQGVRPITEKEYFVRGSTALLDAMGHAITKAVQAQKHTAPAMQANKVLFVITTDGQENASKEYTSGKIKDMVRHQQDEYGWEFLFLGANIDAIATAEQYGISPSRAVNYHADSVGTKMNYMAVSEAISNLRENGAIDEDWKRSVESDYQSRKKKR